MAFMKTTHIIIFAVVIALGGLLFFSAQFATPHEADAFWPGTDIACIPGHQNLSQHFHPTLEIYVAGEKIPVRANIGISDTCMAEMHTHDASGEIHVESLEPGKTFTIADFFSVLDEALYIDGYTLTATVNGEVVEEIENYLLKDHDAVVLSYDLAEAPEN